MVEETGQTSCGRIRPSSTNWLPHAAVETDGLNQGEIGVFDLARDTV